MTAIAALSLLPAQASAQCKGDGPAAVLQCLVTAYAERALPQYEALLASDYHFVTIGDEGSAPLDREADVQQTGSLFGDPSIQKMTFACGTPRSITPRAQATVKGPEFTLGGVDITLTIDALEQGKPQHYVVDRKDCTFVVRAVNQPAPHWEIVRWEDHPEP